MKTKSINRAWREPVYRNSLSDIERAKLLVENTAKPRTTELSEDELKGVAGGWFSMMLIMDTGRAQALSDLSAKYQIQLN